MIKKLFLFTVLSLLAISPAAAQKDAGPEGGSTTPQLTFFNGWTQVALSPAFGGALTTLEIRAGSTFPGRLVRNRATFPIVGGSIEAQSLKGEILHVGGLTLTKATTRVKLENFIINVDVNGIVLTGQVSVNGSVVGRIPLFDLTLATPATEGEEEGALRVDLNGVQVTLRPEAAAALNQVFSTNAFTPGFNIGTATLSGLAFLN